MTKISRFVALITVLCMNSSQRVGATCGVDIALNLTHPRKNLTFNGSESCSLCRWTVSCPSGAILKATILSMRVPGDDQLSFLDLSGDEDGIAFISEVDMVDDAVFEPIISTSSGMVMKFGLCSGVSPGTYINVEFTFQDQLPDKPILSSGGVFSLNNSTSSITIQTLNMSTITELMASLHWFIESIATSTPWMKVEILAMEPGEGTQFCVFDSFDYFGEWVCATDSAPSTVWYSYGHRLRMLYDVQQADLPGTGMTIRVSVVDLGDPSTWSEQSFMLPACNPSVVVEDMTSMAFVNPYYNHSTPNVKYQCRMSFRTRIPGRCVELEHLHLDSAGTIAIQANDPHVQLADVEGSSVPMSSGSSPLRTVSPNEELIVYMTKLQYNLIGDGVMMKAGATDPVLQNSLAPLEFLGMSTLLNDTSITIPISTPGYPTLITGTDFNIWWRITNIHDSAAIKIGFLDFDIGDATFFVDVASPPHERLLQQSGSTIPMPIYSTAGALALLLRADHHQGTGRRGVQFSVSLIIETTSTHVAVSTQGTTTSTTPTTTVTTAPSSPAITATSTDVITATSTAAITAATTSTITTTVTPATTAATKVTHEENIPGYDKIMTIALSVGLTVAFGGFIFAAVKCAKCYLAKPVRHQASSGSSRVNPTDTRRERLPSARSMEPYEIFTCQPSLTHPVPADPPPHYTPLNGCHKNPPEYMALKTVRGPPISRYVEQEKSTPPGPDGIVGGAIGLTAEDPIMNHDYLDMGPKLSRPGGACGVTEMASVVDPRTKHDYTSVGPELSSPGGAVGGVNVVASVQVPGIKHEYISIRPELSSPGGAVGGVTGMASVEDLGIKHEYLSIRPELSSPGGAVGGVNGVASVEDPGIKHEYMSIRPELSSPAGGAMGGVNGVASVEDPGIKHEYMSIRPELSSPGGEVGGAAGVASVEDPGIKHEYMSVRPELFRPYGEVDGATGMSTEDMSVAVEPSNPDGVVGRVSGELVKDPPIKHEYINVGAEPSEDYTHMAPMPSSHSTQHT